MVRTPAWIGSRLVAACWLALGAVAMAGCSSPPVGSWQSDSKLPNGEYNKLVVDGDFIGEAKIYATPANDTTFWVKFKFDVDGAQTEEGTAWVFSMNCKSGPCSGDDFKMTCEVISEGADQADKMNCTGNKKWDDYPFDWERIEE